MDHETTTEIFAELTALRFMLENVWAMLLVSHAAPPDDVRALHADMLRQLALPPTGQSNGAPVPANDTAVQLRAVQRLQSLLSAVEARLAAAR